MVDTVLKFFAIFCKAFLCSFRVVFGYRLHLGYFEGSLWANESQLRWLN